MIMATLITSLSMIMSDEDYSVEYNSTDLFYEV